MTSIATVIANLISENAALRIEAGELTEVLRLVANEVCEGVRPTSADSYLPSDIVREIKRVLGEE